MQTFGQPALGALDAILQWFAPPGPDVPALAATLASQPEAVIPHLVERGVDPDSLSINSMTNPNDPVWSGLAAQTFAAPEERGPAGPASVVSPDSGLAGALAGVRMPQAPEPYIPRIGAPGQYNPPSNIGVPDIANVLRVVSGQASPRDVLRLRTALLGR